jgi:DNA-binding Lrp family transcriptional regulator
VLLPGAVTTNRRASSRGQTTYYPARRMNRHAIVPEAAFVSLAGDATALAVYAVLALHADDDGRCHPHQATVAATLGVSEGTVRRKVKRLVDAGLLERFPLMNGRLKCGNRYVLPDRALVRGRPRAGARSTRARERLLSIKEQTIMNKEIEPATPSERHLASVTPMPEGRMLDVPSIVDCVFDEWRRATRRTGRTILTPKRRKAIEARVKEGYGLDDLLDAVRGWRRSTFHCGANEQETVYNELTLLLRDGEHVERFRDLERGAASEQAAMRESENVALIRRQREREGR